MYDRRKVISAQLSFACRRSNADRRSDERRQYIREASIERRLHDLPRLWTGIFGH